MMIERWVARGGERTCAVCNELHGLIFAADEGPPAPLHPFCRCHRVPAPEYDDADRWPLLRRMTLAVRLSRNRAYAEQLTAPDASRWRLSERAEAERIRRGIKNPPPPP